MTDIDDRREEAIRHIRQTHPLSTSELNDDNVWTIARAALDMSACGMGSFSSAVTTILAAIKPGPVVPPMPVNLAAYIYVAQNLAERVNEPTQQWQIYNKDSGDIVVSVSLSVLEHGITKNLIWAEVIKKIESGMLAATSPADSI